MHIPNQNQVSCLVQDIFYRKWVLCNCQSNATHVRESHTDFAPQTKALPHCCCIIRQILISTENKVCCSFQWKPSGKKKVKNSTWGCKTALKSNNLSKPLNSAKSCNSYTLSFKKMCISSDSDLVWIKHVCKSQHQGLLIMKAASPLALDLHRSTTGDMLMVALQWLVCSQVILPCAAGLSKDQTGQTQELLENIWWPTAGAIPFHNYLSFVLVKEIKMLHQKDSVLLVNQCRVLTMQNGCQTLSGYFAIK